MPSILGHNCVPNLISAHLQIFSHYWGNRATNIGVSATKPLPCGLGIKWVHMDKENTQSYIYEVKCQLGGVKSASFTIIFTRDLFSCFSQVMSHSQKLKPQNFCYTHAEWANHVSMQHYFKLSAVLTPREACHWAYLWRQLLQSIRKSKWYVSTDEWTRQ